MKIVAVEDLKESYNINDIPPEILEYLLYHNGKLFWKKKPCRSVLVGAEAGKIDKNGARLVGFQKKHYFAHRVIWFMHHGSVEGIVDHKDGDNSNNKIENLRLGTQSNNRMNQHKTNAKSGYKGVAWANGCWSAKIKYKGKVEYLYYGQDIVAAAKAYDKRARELFGPFAKTNFGE